jgi:homoserine acetyltransferase
LLKQLLAAARFSLRDFPKCPALVISSQNDNLVHPSCSTKLASHLSALAAIHPSAGHDLPLDDGPWLAREIASWQPKLEI